jgi:hypothetical protein
MGTFESGSAIVEEARIMPRFVVDTFLGTDEHAAKRAVGAIMYLGELVIVPVIETDVPGSLRNRDWLLGRAVAEELALRDKLIAHLNKLLDDHSRLPDGYRGPPVEGGRRLRDRRVCDSAYLLMRKLRHPEFSHPHERDDLERQHEDVFLHAPMGFKDEEIARARQSGSWARQLSVRDVDRWVEKHKADDAPPPKQQ